MIEETRTLSGWEGWNSIMMAIYRATGGSDEGFAVANAWSAKNKTKYNEKYTHHTWYHRYRRSPPNSIGAGTLFTIAETYSPGWQKIYDEEAVNSAFDKPDAPKPDAPDPQPDSPDSAPTLSEDYLALQFTKEHAGTLRYVSPWGKWLIYSNGKWNFDEKLKAYSLARNICRTAARAMTNGKKEAKTIASAKTRSAVISLASGDPVHAASTDQWDTDPWLLNTPDGVIDLKTGKSRDHRAADYMTKMTAVSPDRACLIPLWENFLIRVTAGNIELQKYLQRMAGYGLTGITIEHALFFLYGTGRNGKGVFLNTVAKILGDYHVTASQETFIASTNERHPTDLAMLRGARLVTVAETEQGKRWAESRIKQMTGGDPITARFMRQDFFEYDPQFKLLISGQHRPGLNAVNEAIKSRFNMVPFTVTIPEKQRDKNLTKKLEAEWPGILAWMIEGCLEWQKIGLSPPAIVVAETAEYLKGEDKLARWIDERCERNDSWWTSSSELFASWKSWAEENNEYLVSQTKFSNDLKEAGFEKDDRRNANGFKGLKVLPRERFTEEGDRYGNKKGG
jgi:putative DNA primase/helicase